MKEYKVINTQILDETSTKSLERTLNELALDKWEVINSNMNIINDNNTRIFIILERNRATNPPSMGVVHGKSRV